MNTDKKKILILFAHPALQKSRVNKHLIRHVKDMEGVTFHDLYEAYPDFHIDVASEQKLLKKNDIIILHHPLFWFSLPALMKEWMDLVLEHMWAYGKKGRALKGKILMNVITTGGRESLFRHEAYNKHTMLEFLFPVQQTAFICGMKYLPPFVVHGTHTVTREQINLHGNDYRDMVSAMRDGLLDIDKAANLSRINSDMERILMEKKK